LEVNQQESKTPISGLLERSPTFGSVHSGEEGGMKEGHNRGAWKWNLETKLSAGGQLKKKVILRGQG